MCHGPSFLVGINSYQPVSTMSVTSWNLNNTFIWVLHLLEFFSKNWKILWGNMIVATNHSSPTIDQETKSWLPYCVVCSYNQCLLASLPNFLLQSCFLMSTSRKLTKALDTTSVGTSTRVRRNNYGIVLLLNDKEKSFIQEVSIVLLKQKIHNTRLISTNNITS